MNVRGMSGVLRVPHEGQVVKANAHAMTVIQDHKITYFYRKTHWDNDEKDYMRNGEILTSCNSPHYKSIVPNNTCGSSNILPSTFFWDPFEDKNANKDRSCPVCDMVWEYNHDFIQ